MSPGEVDVRTQTIRVGGARIDINFPVDGRPVPGEELTRWVKTSAESVAAYFGRFPVPDLEVTILTAGRGGVGYGHAFRGRRIRVYVGPKTTTAGLHDDWVMVHEMLHLCFPDLERRHRWMQEGLSTYLEPIVRARAGNLTDREVWSEWVDRMPYGLPRDDDEGLDHTPTWGRTYWGGALFWLLVDLGIRQDTHNELSIRDALVAVLAAGGNYRVDWPVSRVLEVGDAATGTHVLHDVYESHALRRTEVDLPALWRRLGVMEDPPHVTFDDHAKDATVRAAITSG